MHLLKNFLPIFIESTVKSPSACQPLNTILQHLKHELFRLARQKIQRTKKRESQRGKKKINNEKKE